MKAEQFSTHKGRIDQHLEHLLAAVNAPSPLKEAMHYGVFNGGKRIRPILLYLVCEALGAKLELADTPAAAIEFMHAYSLIHDDLPAMDDDDLRRGKPTCHIKYGEANAILAGDALQNLAFEVIAAEQELDAATRLKLIQQLGAASGASGMIAGQAIDMTSESVTLGSAELENMHRLKTGQLIVCSINFASIISGAEPATCRSFSEFGNHLGLAFQIRDDILDVVGEQTEIGKPVGSDHEQQKATFVSSYGLEGAKLKLDQAFAQIEQELASLGQGTDTLLEFSRFLIKRNH